MNLIGEKVTNAKNGIGTITSIDGGYMAVQFAEKVSKFRYPDAFQKHVSLVNEVLQAEMNAIATAVVEEKELAEEKEKAQMFNEICRVLKKRACQQKRNR